MKKEIECPYCGGYSDEPEECYEQDVSYQVECTECGKIFMSSVYYLKCWSSGEKVDCLNGGDHNYEHEVRSYGDKLQIYHECNCGERILIKEEGGAS